MIIKIHQFIPVIKISSSLYDLTFFMSQRPDLSNHKTIEPPSPVISHHPNAGYQYHSSTVFEETRFLSMGPYKVNKKNYEYMTKVT